MTLLNNTSIINNPPNETLCDSDCTNFFKQAFLAITIFYILISSLIIIGNTLVLLATCRERRLHQPNKYSIACLAVADLLVGMFIGPSKLYLMYLDYKSRRDISIHFCRFMVWIDTLAVTASAYTLTFISFDRYLKISKPLQYRSKMTTLKSLKIIFIIWLISTAFATYSATPDSGSQGLLLHEAVRFCFPAEGFSENKSNIVYTILLVSLIILPAIVILSMYSSIFVAAHKRQKMLRNGELGETSTGQNQRSVLRQDLKIVRMLLIVVGVFLFSVIPSFISFVSYIYNRNIFNGWSFKSLYIYFRVIWLLPLTNSLCNPLIYACLDQTYREAFKHLFQKMMCRANSNTQQPPAVVIELHQFRNS